MAREKSKPNQKWSEEEINEFKKMYPTGDTRYLCEYFNTGVNGLRFMAHKTGTKRVKVGHAPGKPWSRYEDDILQKFYDKMPVGEIEKLLSGRTRNAIILRAGKLGIRSVSENDYSEDEYNFIIDNYRYMSDDEIAKHLGRCRASIKNHRNKLGCHRTNLEKTNYEDALIFIRKNNLEWKQKSMFASDYQCIVTKERFDDIHHLVSLNKIVRDTIDKYGYHAETFDINNLGSTDRKLFLSRVLMEQDKYPLGVCLSKKIHKQFHSEYGYGDNTPEQFRDFLERFYPDVRYNAV